MIKMLIKKVEQVAELSGLKNFINRSEGLNYEILENGKSIRRRKTKNCHRSSAL